MTNNIYKKILSIQNKVINGLRKEEENKFQKYRYVSEYDILKLLKPLLEEEKLLIIVSDDLLSMEEMKIADSNRSEWKVRYLKKILIVNVDDSQEKLELFSWACAQNSDLAKAKGSAETYFLKYFLIKFFLIPTYDNLDPDFIK